MDELTSSTKDINKKRKTEIDENERENKLRNYAPLLEKMEMSNKIYYPSHMGCRSVEEFEKMNWIEEGMFGVVFRARDIRTNETVALKKLKMEREREGFPITSLREINCLLKARHENIVALREVVVGDNMNNIFIVMDYIEHDLKSLMDTMKQPFTLDQTKTLMIQLLRGIAHLHDNWIVHRDIKTSNLLLNHRGILKIGDFGLAREYGSPLASYTPVVVTLWYRCPELLLGLKEYSTPIDIWSVGCVFAELIAKKALFPAKSEAEQLSKIFKEFGTPNDRIWPGPPAFSQLPFAKNLNFKPGGKNNLKSRFSYKLTPKGIDLMSKFFIYDPSRRISAIEALDHSFFQEFPLPTPPSLFPTWPTKHEREYRRNKPNASPKAPEGGGEYQSINIDDQISASHVKSSKSDMGFVMSATGKGTIKTIHQNR